MIIDKQAEIKPFKFGELLTGNAADNPEPSSSASAEQACVETGRKVCIKCEGTISAGKYKNAIYCSVRCRSAYVAYRHAVKTGRIKTPGVGSGGNQEGELNSMYKNGIGTYSKGAFKHYGRKCNRCPRKTLLLVHHIDENRNNNNLDNLEVLCKRCHQEHHCIRDEKGKYTKGQSMPLRNQG